MTSLHLKHGLTKAIHILTVQVNANSILVLYVDIAEKVQPVGNNIKYCLFYYFKLLDLPNSLHGSEFQIVERHCKT